MGDAPLDDCGWLDVGCGIGNVVKGGIEEFVRSLADGAVQFLGWLTSFWINIPSPDVQSDAIGQITSGLHFYTIVLAIVGLLVTLIRMIFSNSFRDGMPAVKMIVNLIVVTGVYTAATTALILAGDSFAPWIIERATGTQDLDLTQLLTTQAIMTAGVGPGVLLGIVALLGSLMNVILMILRGVLVTLVFAFLPALAAASATEAGNQAFKKAQGYLLALILFKPVAAVIYALGLLLIRTPPSFTTTDELGASLYHVSVGVMTLLIAGLALPAIIKFIAPVAAGGVSSAFSGAGLAAGGVAAGAAVVSLGAGAAAGGALAAKGAATTASTAGNAAAATGQGARAVASTAANNSGGGGGRRSCRHGTAHGRRRQRCALEQRRQLSEHAERPRRLCYTFELRGRGRRCANFCRADARRRGGRRTVRGTHHAPPRQHGTCCRSDRGRGPHHQPHR